MCHHDTCWIAWCHCIRFVFAISSRKLSVGGSCVGSSHCATWFSAHHRNCVQAVNITTFVILLSIYLIGPTTAPLLKCMKIPINVPYEANHGRTYFSKWQICVDDFLRKKVVRHVSRGRSSSKIVRVRFHLSINLLVAAAHARAIAAAFYFTASW